MESFDPSSGQIFFETIAPVRSMVPKWYTMSRGTPDNPKLYRNSGTGSSTLYDVALRSCAWNADLFTPEALKNGEWYYSERIYRRLKETDSLTPAAWDLFRVVFPEETDRTYEAYIVEREGTAPLELNSIVACLMRPSSDYLSFLCIRNLRLTSKHLMALLDISELAVLVLEQDPSLLYDKNDYGVSDKFMRDWGRAVNEKGAFKKLQVLRLRSFTAGMTDTIRGLTVFPALRFINLDSWWTGHDLIGMKSGTVTGNGRWQCLGVDAIKAPVENASINDPQAIWRRTDLTIHRKMELLYDLAGKHSQETPLGNPVASVLSLHYGDSTVYTYSDQKRYSAWFTSITPSADEPKQLLKRPSKNDEGPNRPNEDANKKRRMRKGKKMDLGSVLGSFI